MFSVHHLRMELHADLLVPFAQSCNVETFKSTLGPLFSLSGVKEHHIWLYNNLSQPELFSS